MLSLMMKNNDEIITYLRAKTNLVLFKVFTLLESWQNLVGRQSKMQK